MRQLPDLGVLETSIGRDIIPQLQASPDTPWGYRVRATIAA